MEALLIFLSIIVAILSLLLYLMDKLFGELSGMHLHQWFIARRMKYRSPEEPRFTERKDETYLASGPGTEIREKENSFFK